jgi:hypothetical protein
MIAITEAATFLFTFSPPFKHPKIEKGLRRLSVLVCTLPLAFEDYAFGGFLSEGFLNFLLNLFSGLLNLLVVYGYVWTFIVCYVA